MLIEEDGKSVHCEMYFWLTGWYLVTLHYSRHLPEKVVPSTSVWLVWSHTRDETADWNNTQSNQTRVLISPNNGGLSRNESCSLFQSPKYAKFSFFPSKSKRSEPSPSICCEMTACNVAMRKVFDTVLINRGGGVLPYMGYIGMCGPKGYGFSAVLVINRVSIWADFGHFGHK